MSDDGPSDGGPRMGHHGNKSKSPVLPDYGTPVCLEIGASMFKRWLNVFRERRLDKELREKIETHLASVEEEAQPV